MAPIKLLIVDDHPVFRQGLRDVFATDEGIIVVGEASDGPQALNVAQQQPLDVVLMDINLPGSSGLQATYQLHETYPHIKVVMITGYDEPEQIFHSLQAGAVAFCSKDLPPESLINAVHAAHSGQFVIQSQILSEKQAKEWVEKRVERFGKRPTSEYGRDTSPLTPREMEILEMICRGATNKEIARQLGISYQTVKNHVTAVLRKLGVKDRTQAVLYAIRQEWFAI